MSSTASPSGRELVDEPMCPLAFAPIERADRQQFQCELEFVEVEPRE